MALPAIITAVAGFVELGASAVGAQAVGNEYTIRVAIAVDNLTKNALMEPNLSMEHGECDQPPVIIAPGYKEVMVARKHSLTATGSFGVVSWQIGDTEKRLVIMWSVPFDYNLYDNWMAVGICKAKTHDPKWATEMYYAEKDRGSWFERAKYDTSVSSVTWIDGNWAVTATMSTAHHADVRVTFAPTCESDVAPCLMNKIGKAKKAS